MLQLVSKTFEMTLNYGNTVYFLIDVTERIDTCLMDGDFQK